MLAETFTDGFLVLHRGQIVAEHYFNGMAQDVPHLLMSVSKSVTSAVAGVLAGRGALAVSAGVAEIVPELRGTSFQGATVQDLLDMRAGTRFDENYENVKADVRACEKVYLWRPDDGEPEARGRAGLLRATLANDGSHGGPFRYRSILTDVLAWVAASGRRETRLHELVARELWQPMGAEFDAEVTVDAHGNPMADGGICATLRDVARFGQLYLQRGRARGRSIAPGDWIEDTIRGAADGATAFCRRRGGRAIRPGCPTCAIAGGSGIRPFRSIRRPASTGQNIFVHVPSQTVVAKLSTWPTALSPAGAPTARPCSRSPVPCRPADRPQGTDAVRH